MTQSSVSQHISKLEEQLGVSLFIRNSRSTNLTDAGNILLEYIQHYNNSIISLLYKISSQNGELEGSVNYAIPPSCILSHHFPRLLERRLDHPSVELIIGLLPNDKIIREVIFGQANFGIVTEKVSHPLLDYQEFCKEEYILVSSIKSHTEMLTDTKLLDQRFVNYPGMNTYFNLWVQHFFPESQSINYRSLRHAGEINTIDGAIMMVLGGMGFSVFPRYCVQQYIEDGRLHEYRDEHKSPLRNSIYIITKTELDLPLRVKTVIQWLTEIEH